MERSSGRGRSAAWYRHPAGLGKLVPAVLLTALVYTSCSTGVATMQPDGPSSVQRSDAAQVAVAAPPAAETPQPAAPAAAASPVGAVRVSGDVPLPVLEDLPDGSFLVRTPCGRPAVARHGEPLSDIDVLIDPGHGGGQPGAVGPGGLPEKVVNLDVSRLLATALEQRGFTTLLTRTSDYRLSLDTRGDLARTLRPRAFVSVHFNAEPDETRATPGTETYYQHRSAESRRLAGLLYEEIYRALAKHPIVWVSDRDAGVKKRINDAGDDYYAVLRLTGGTPAALVEAAFISNAAEEQLIGDRAVQAGLADAMAQGVERFLTTDDPGSGYVDAYFRPSPVPSGGGNASCVDPDLGLDAGR